MNGSTGSELRERALYVTRRAGSVEKLRAARHAKYTKCMIGKSKIGDQKEPHPFEFANILIALERRKKLSKAQVAGIVWIDIGTSKSTRAAGQSFCSETR